MTTKGKGAGVSSPTADTQAEPAKPASVYGSLKEYTNENVEFFARQQRLMEVEFERAKWNTALVAFGRTGNPVFAFAALAHWPADEPISADVLDWLRRTGRAVERAALRVMDRDSRMDIADANQAVLRALGFVRGQQKGSNALAEVRDDALARSVAETRHEIRIASLIPSFRFRE